MREGHAVAMPNVEERLVPRVDLLCAVCYSLQSVDMWCMAVQAASSAKSPFHKCVQRSGG